MGTLDVLIQRHGQSMGNVGCDVLDPSLTELGVQQASQASDFIANRPDFLPNITVSSGLTRAMQTAAITFGRITHVADYIPEMPFDVAGHCPDHFDDCAVTPEKQIEFMKDGRNVTGCVGPPTPSIVQNITWDYLGGRNSNFTI